MFTMCYTRSSITDISLFRKSELRDEGGNKMGNYNDFDLNIKNIQTQKEDENLRFTSIYTCGDYCSCGDTCYNTCGGLQTSCSGHCR